MIRLLVLLSLTPLLAYAACGSGNAPQDSAEGANTSAARSEDPRLGQSLLPLPSDLAFSVTFRLDRGLGGEEFLIWWQASDTRRVDILTRDQVGIAGNFAVETGIGEGLIGSARSLSCLWTSRGLRPGTANVMCGAFGFSGPVFGAISILAIAQAQSRLDDRTVLGRPTSCYDVSTSYAMVVCLDADGVPLYMKARSPDGQVSELEAVHVGTDAPRDVIDDLQEFTASKDFTNVDLTRLDVPKVP